MKLSRTKIARLLKTGNQSRKKRDNKKRRQSLFSKDDLILLPTNRKARSATNKPSKPFNLRYKTMKRQRGGDKYTWNFVKNGTLNKYLKDMMKN